jgi:hypothetical protein
VIPPKQVAQAERIGGAGLLVVPAFDFFVWALDTYARGNLLVSLHDQLPPILLNPGVGFLCMCGGLGLLYMAQEKYLASMQKSSTLIVDSKGNAYAGGSASKWLVPIGVVFLLALLAAPILALTFSLTYRGTPPPSPKEPGPPPLALHTTEQFAPAKAANRKSVTIKQAGKNNIAQVGNNNSATITGVIPFRALTEDQKRGITAFLDTMPQSVLVSVGALYGSGDAATYAGDFFPLFEGRHLDNQTVPAIRTGFPITFTGVFVATRSDEENAIKYRDAFVDALAGLGIPERSANGSKVPPGDLEFLVGFRPEEVKQP